MFYLQNQSAIGFKFWVSFLIDGDEEAVEVSSKLSKLIADNFDTFSISRGVAAGLDLEFWFLIFLGFGRLSESSEALDGFFRFLLFGLGSSANASAVFLLFCFGSCVFLGCLPRKPLQFFEPHLHAVFSLLKQSVIWNL